jgi:hypothetical protein
MTAELSEEEMRQALFGPSNHETSEPPLKATTPITTPEMEREPRPTRRSNPKPLSPKLRVTLHVTKEFEGPLEVLIYDVNTLSTLIAEKEAKTQAKKKFRYIDVVSVLPIQS